MNLKDVEHQIKELQELKKALEAKEKAKQDLIKSLSDDIRSRIERLGEIDKQVDKLKSERSNLVEYLKENLTSDQMDILGVTIRKGRGTANGETKVSRVKKYIAENPGCTKKDIESAIGEDVHSALWQLVNQKGEVEKRDGKYYLA